MRLCLREYLPKQARLDNTERNRQEACPQNTQSKKKQSDTSTLQSWRLYCRFLLSCGRGTQKNCQSLFEVPDRTTSTDTNTSLSLLVLDRKLEYIKQLYATARQCQMSRGNVGAATSPGISHLAGTKSTSSRQIRGEDAQGTIREE